MIDGGARSTKAYCVYCGALDGILHEAYDDSPFILVPSCYFWLSLPLGFQSMEFGMLPSSNLWPGVLSILEVTFFFMILDTHVSIHPWNP